MNYQIDHDVHIHSQFSPCSSDPRQTPEAILAYGITNGYKLICLADHAWDGKVHTGDPIWPTYDKWQAKHPSLPQGKTCRFLKGLEADMDCDDVIGLSKETAEALDCFIISPSHMHIGHFTATDMADAEKRVPWYIKRCHIILDSDLPLEKASLAHFDFDGVCMGRPLHWLELISDAQLTDIFTKVKKRGMGVELNFNPYRSEADLRILLRPYRIARDLGCVFTLGGDAHKPEAFGGGKARAERMVALLELQEEQKHPLIREWVK